MAIDMGVSIVLGPGGTLKQMAYFMETPIYKWMIWG